MADSLREELDSFLDDCVTGLTNLHVLAAQYQNAPHDQDAVDALAGTPSALIERAQNLKARLDADTDDDDGDGDEPKAKAAKPKAAKR